MSRRVAATYSSLFLIFLFSPPSYRHGLHPRCLLLLFYVCINKGYALEEFPISFVHFRTSKCRTEASYQLFSLFAQFSCI
ncbi:hypothetical protein K1719_045702 [Acacia pycnantha]|nr:hypothetical protein K1719_046660 [Acacia pycnantha]KAI9072339.1 hypothetical protein K1719_045702 [Acacia pycnantha]